MIPDQEQAPKPKEVEVTSIYERNLRTRKKIVINRGGARSSKSYSLAQLWVQYFTSEGPGLKFLVTRKTGPALKLTAYKLVIDMMRDYGFLQFCKWNQSDKTLEFRGNFMAFLSVDDPDKIKSTEWNFIWMEEADEFTWTDFVTLKTRLSGKLPGELKAGAKKKAPQKKRTKKKTPDRQPLRNQIFLSYNPTDVGDFINTILLDKETDVEIIHSTWRDNPFIGQDYVDTLEELKGQDESFYQIFNLGEYGTLTSIIYQSYIMHAENDWPRDKDFDEVIAGLDFGYTKPCALVDIGIANGGRDLYFTERLYQTKLNTAQLLMRLEMLETDKQRRIYCDSEDPRMIEELAAAGFIALKCEKGADSVFAGIMLLKGARMHSRASNVNLNNERKIYKWHEDKDGNPTDVPVKFRDHLMDAKRLAWFTHHRILHGVGDQHKKRKVIFG